MSKIKSEYFLEALFSEVQSSLNKTTYMMNREYGQGRVMVYSIIPGMYLTFSEFKIRKVVNKSHYAYPNFAINIDYCIKGSYICNFESEKVCSVNKGNNAYYTGPNNFVDVIFDNNQYQSLNLFCYVEQVAESFCQLFGLPKERIMKYYDKLKNRDNFLVIESSFQIISIVKELCEYIQTDNLELIKLRALELFISEINHYEQYKNRKKQYFQKSIVNDINRIEQYMKKNIQEHMTISQLSDKHNMSSTRLKECFKHVYGTGPYTHLRKLRMEKAAELLQNKNLNILEVANMLGYTNQSKFTSAFKNHYGITPAKYRQITEDNILGEN